MKYVLFTESRFSLYDDEINTSVPDGARALSEDQYARMCSDQSGKWGVVGGEVVMTPAAVLPAFPRFVGNEKLDLFTPAEQYAVAEAASTDPLVALTFYRMINAAYLSYESPETEQGLALLEDKGLLLPNRKAEIVAKMQPSV